MGFFNHCLDVLLSLPFFSTVGTLDYYDSHQQPIPFPKVPSNDVVVHPVDASPGFTCSYPRLSNYESCNTAEDRSCWLQDTSVNAPLFTQFDINTDYEQEGSWPTGITREYWLNVTDQEIHPDGYSKPLGKVINGTYPGPIIEACWGDEIVVHVTNWLHTNGTTIHWHGIRQQHSNEMDGVNGVTQCPIAYGEEFTYRFRAQQYGTTWYHSHYSLQYPDGVAGPLVIHGPSSSVYDEEIEPLIMNDWVHSSAFAVFQVELNKLPPTGDSILLNGHGHYNCSLSINPDTSLCVGGGSYLEQTFQQGKKYLLRLINASAATAFIFSIDGHNLTVVQNDLVPIVPYNTNAILLNIGQRYNVIVEANASPGDYWMRTEIPGGPGGCGAVSDRANNVTGIVRYDSSSTALPTTVANDYPSDCHDEPADLLVPVLPWHVDSHPQNTNISNDTFEVGLSKLKYHGYIRWEVGSVPLWLDFGNPTILNLENTTWNPEYDIVEYDYNQGFVYLIISANLPTLNTTRPVPAGHPIHLHGHDFAVLAQENSTYDEVESPKNFTYANPPRRDVAFLPSNGYLALAFKPDNPGVWLVHCHIAWHASSGLALQILERQADILDTIGTLERTNDTCKGWDSYVAANPIDQDDSGI
ncbi:multicopper oxidase [Saccharata proteae CBS 121410]|uniref:Multicopper oxidase n=1 Tax=Saccharata proteae CBS 121410 TaxID=1314787 RepID=A0A9P4HZA2_9PEZI|nr:multicopper oxidase [Saccharata proteae CBS 121410]